MNHAIIFTATLITFWIGYATCAYLNSNNKLPTCVITHQQMIDVANTVNRGEND